MAKKVLDEMPKEETKAKAKKVAPSKEEAEKALEEVEKEEKFIEEGKKCNKKKFIMPAIIVLIVAIVGCVCFFGYRMIFGNNPVNITTKAIRGLKDKIKDATDDTDGVSKIISGNDPFELTTNLTVSLPQGMGKYNLDLLLQADGKNEEGKFNIIAKQNKKDILNLNAALSNSKLYFKLADTMKNYYYYDITKIVEQFTKEMSEVQSKINPEILTQISNYDFTKLIDYVADSIDENLTKDDFEKSKEEITVKGKDVNATKYTAKIDEKLAIKIAKSFAKKVQNDKDLIKLAATITGAKESEIKDAIKQIIDKEPENLSKDYVLYSVYVSSLGSTLGYGFEIEDKGRVIITEKDDVTTINVYVGQYNGSIEINEKDDDHVVITASVMGMINAEINIKSDTDTVKKNRDYKEKLDVKFTVSAMGQSMEASLNAESRIKKIDKVDLSEVKDAINVEKMTSDEASKFQREVEKSSFYTLVMGLMKNKAQTPSFRTMQPERAY